MYLQSNIDLYDMASMCYHHAKYQAQRAYITTNVRASPSYEVT